MKYFLRFVIAISLGFSLGFIARLMGFIPSNWQWWAIVIPVGIIIYVLIRVIEKKYE